MAIPVIGLFVYANINPFHFSIPHIIFNIKIEDKPLFELKIFSIDDQPVKTEHSMIIIPDGGIELIKELDLIIIPGWDDFNHKPEPILIDSLNWAYKTGIRIVMHWRMQVYSTIKKQQHTGWLNKISVRDFHKFSSIVMPFM